MDDECRGGSNDDLHLKGNIVQTFLCKRKKTVDSDAAADARWCVAYGRIAVVRRENGQRIEEIRIGSCRDEQKSGDHLYKWRKTE